MFTGSLTSYMDVAQVTLYAFWFFFAGLVWYLRSEDKREGYPLTSERYSGTVKVQGLPPVPSPKTFILRDGSTYQAPPGNIDARPLAAAQLAPWRGAPMMPTGNALADGVGPASFVNRHNSPDLTAEGEPVLAPLRIAKQFFVEPNDPDPRGFDVVGSNGKVAGTVADLWIDRTEPQIRYLEVELPAGRNVLLPINFARISRSRRVVRVVSINAAQFADVPPLPNPDQITPRDEDRITAYYGGGRMFAAPLRTEPAL